MFSKYLDKLDTNYISNTIDQLQMCQVTLRQIHNKKYYAKKQGHIIKVLELALIEELYKYGG